MQVTENISDFETDKVTVRSVNTLPNGNYPTLSPLVQLHIQRLWVTGVCADNEAIYLQVQKLDPRAKKNTVLQFLEDHTTREDWIERRERFLQAQYDKYVADVSRITEFIDERYDGMFEKIRSLCEQQLEHFAVLSEQGLVPTRLFNLKAVAETVAKAYEMQRLARNMSQGNISVKTVKDESPEFTEALKKLDGIINERIIDVSATVLKPM